MTTTTIGRPLRSRHGGAMIEFALIVPLLFLLCMAAGDFGRLHFYTVTVVNAAATAAHFGSLGNAYAAQSDRLQDRAEQEAGDLPSASATATQFCDCPPAGDADFTTNPTLVDCDLAATPGTCPAGGYGLPRVYVRADVDETFETLGPYPGIPENSDIGRTAFMRVQ